MYQFKKIVSLIIQVATSNYVHVTYVLISHNSARSVKVLKNQDKIITDYYSNIILEYSFSHVLYNF